MSGRTEDSRRSMAVRRCGRRGTLAAIGALVAAEIAGPAALAQVTTPQRGAPLRSAILDALRPVVERELGGKVEFVVSQMRVQGEWAYVSAQPQRPGGVAIDWRATKFRKAWDDDMMSDLVLALLRREGNGWKVVEYAIGPTDVAWEDWIKPHGVSRHLFIDQ